MFEKKTFTFRQPFLFDRKAEGEPQREGMVTQIVVLDECCQTGGYVVKQVYARTKHKLL